MVDSGSRGKEGKRVLAVDDDADILAIVAANLELDGYAVETVLSGEECLRSARENPPDVIVLDVLMPKMGGEEVVRQLRADPELAGIPIIMLTAVGDRHFKRAALSELGVDSYIVKPFEADDLSAKAQQVLRYHHRP